MTNTYSDTECSICFDEINTNYSVACSYCINKFCTKCITEYYNFNENIPCPLCNSNPWKLY